MEVVQSGADLGMYEDDAAGEPDDTLRVVNTTATLPIGQFPSIKDAQAEFDSVVQTLNATRETGTEAEIKLAVSNAKRANFVLRNSLRTEEGPIGMRVQAMRIGPAALVGIPVEAFCEIGMAVKEHCEEILMQERCMELIKEMPEFEMKKSYLEYAVQHHKIIQRFGQFPHRNAILGRKSTPEEREFLHEPDSGF